MNTFPIGIPVAANPAASRRPGPVLRALQVALEAVADTNRRRAEREIARVARTYGLGAADPA
jgi:hypothetical protein